MIIFEAWSDAGSKTGPSVAMQVVERAEVKVRDFDLPLAKLKHVVNEDKNSWEASYPGPKRLEIMPFNMHYKPDSRYYVQIRNSAVKDGPEGAAPETAISLRLIPM